MMDEFDSVLSGEILLDEPINPLSASNGHALRITSYSLGPKGVEDLIEPIWDQQPHEPPVYYERFKIYMNQPPKDRSFVGTWAIARVLEKPHAREASSNRNNSLQINANRWFWRERAIAHDKYVEEQRRAEWAKREDQKREREWKLSEKLFDICEEAVDIMHDENMDVIATPKNFVLLANAAAKLADDSNPGVSLNSPEEVAKLLDVLPPERASRIRMMLLMEKTNT